MQTWEYNETMSRQLVIRLTVPDELDPHQVLWCMGDDFFYANRHSDDIGPHLDSITFEVIEEVAQK